MEVIQDGSLRLAPVDDALAEDIFRDLRCSRVLGPYRGLQAADTATEALSRLSLWIHHFSLIREVDINPIVLGDHGEQGVAVDARVLLETPNHEDPLL